MSDGTDTETITTENRSKLIGVIVSAFKSEVSSVRKKLNQRCLGIY